VFPVLRPEPNPLALGTSSLETLEVETAEEQSASISLLFVGLQILTWPG
jgi:hypothetical protein